MLPYVIECNKIDPGCYGVNTFIYHVFQESQSVFSLSHSFWCTVQQICHSGTKYSFHFGFHNAPTFLYWIDWGTVRTCFDLKILHHHQKLFLKHSEQGELSHTTIMLLKGSVTDRSIRRTHSQQSSRM